MTADKARVGRAAMDFMDYLGEGSFADADRLNLWRVGIKPEPALLSTRVAKKPWMIERGRVLQDKAPPSWLDLGKRYAAATSEGAA